MDEGVALVLVLIRAVVVRAWRRESVLYDLLVLGSAFEGVILLRFLRVALTLVAVCSVRFVVLCIVLHHIIILVARIVVLLLEFVQDVLWPTFLDARVPVSLLNVAVLGVVVL